MWKFQFKWLLHPSRIIWKKEENRRGRERIGNQTNIGKIEDQTKEKTSQIMDITPEEIEEIKSLLEKSTEAKDIRNYGIDIIIPNTKYRWILKSISNWWMLMKSYNEIQNWTILNIQFKLGWKIMELQWKVIYETIDWCEKTYAIKFLNITREDQHHITVTLASVELNKGAKYTH